MANALDTQQFIAVKTQLESLETLLFTLKKSLASSKAKHAWLPECGTIAPNEKKSLRTKAIKSLTHTMNENEWQPFNAGLIYCPPAAASLIEEINSLKEEIKQEVRGIREANNKGKSISLATIGQAHQKQDAMVHATLDALNLSRLNLLWVYRHIRLLPPNLDAVSWSWSQSSSIRKVTVQEAVALTERLNESAAEYALKLLGQLGSSEILAQCKPVKRHLRANIKWQEEGQTHRKMITTPTVALYQDDNLPNIRWPDDKPASRQRRNDRKIDEQPYIQSLRLHRYIGANNE